MIMRLLSLMPELPISPPRRIIMNSLVAFIIFKFAQIKKDDYNISNALHFVQRFYQSFGATLFLTAPVTAPAPGEL